MIVGLTGGIGSGKTTVANIFKVLGIPVFIADVEAKKLYSENQVQKEVVSLLGSKAFDNRSLNATYIAEKVFSNPNLLKALNQIIHPRVARRFDEWYSSQKEPYVLREAAILYEVGADKDCDAVVVVSAPEEMRVERVMSRGGETEEQVRDRMKRQMPQAEKEKRADYIITNDHSKSLIYQVLEVHEDLIRRANSKS